MRLSRPALLTAAFYTTMFAALGAYLPFWPVWLEDWGLSTAEVGLFLSLSMLTRTAAGFALPMIADRLDRRRATMAALCICAAMLFVAHLWADTRTALLILTLASGAIFSGLMPLGEALGAGASRRFGFAYARVRSAGSISFLAASMALGVLIAAFGANAALWTIVIFLIASAALGLVHPGGGTLKGQSPPALSDIFRLMTDRTFLLFTAAAALAQSSHAVYYAYGSVHWRALGMSEPRIGALWSFSVVVEIVLMLGPGAWLMARLGPVGALAGGAVAGIVRWSLMVFDPTGAMVWVLQSLHAFSFALGHLGAMAFIAAAVPERFGGTAQGAYTGLAGGLLTAAAMGASAALYPIFGGGTYLLAAAMSATGLLLFIGLARRWQGQELSF
ncbi:MFS transporter [Algicella marina]|nr:MFS transporter [Algicella marina]